MATKTVDDGAGHCWLVVTQSVSERQEQCKDSNIGDGRSVHDPTRTAACSRWYWYLDGSKISQL